MAMTATTRTARWLCVSILLLLSVSLVRRKESVLFGEHQEQIEQLQMGRQPQEQPRRLLSKRFFRKQQPRTGTRRGAVRKKTASYATEDERTKDLQRKGSSYGGLIRKYPSGENYYYTQPRKGGQKSNKRSKKKKGKGGKGKYGGKASKQLSCSGKGKGRSSSLDLGIPADCRDFDFADMSSSFASPFDGTPSNNCQPNVLHQLADHREFATFLHLIAMADLTCLFHCGGPFTVLAPANNAFLNLDPYEFSKLLQPENRVMLQELIMRHVVPGRHFSSDLQPGPLTTLAMQDTLVALDPPKFDQANVVSPDNEACNGVVHGIDEVLGEPSNAGKNQYC